MIRRRDLWPLGATAFILAVTAGWWALALWSAPGAPEWLERTRSVCFNVTDNGLPDAKGWLLLVGQPPSMLAMLFVGWRAEVRETFSHLASSLRGRLLLATTTVLMVCGFSLAGARVAGARLPEVTLSGDATTVGHLRVDRPWPDSDLLVDQTGNAFTSARLRGSPAMVTFAFGHCETVCPTIVHEARAARLTLGAPIPIVVLTLDPWRDTPARLPTLLEQFELDPAVDHVLGGPVGSVEAALDAWGISRQRDGRTGDIVHPSLVYLVDEGGTIAYASSGAQAQLVGLGERLGWREWNR